MALLDLLGRRATLRVLWELRANRSTFRALVDAAQTNPSVLNTRLGELREAGIVDHDEAAGGYGLTVEGADLLARLAPLHGWAEDWAQRKRG
jgi:DNA-binding HxlR family transcriptional regulator